jgi:diacylglycerol O-acyltransferase / wax synthase
VDSPRQLSRTDVLFIAGEDEKTYHHTAGLVILDTSSNPGLDFEQFKRHITERIKLIPHFHWKLHQVPMGLDLPYWVEDENFNYDYHIKRIAVPPPGDRESLGEMVAHLYSRHLDRSRPLWEIWFIEGLPGQRVAVLQKLHHALMDGQGASKLGEALSDFSPQARDIQVDKNISEAKAGSVPTDRELTVTAARHLMKLPLDTSRTAYGFIRPRLLKKLRNWREPTPERRPLPITRWNAQISGERGFVFGSLPLSDIKRVKDAHDVTVNDVVLAVVAASLRSYLENLGELPGDPLVASIAVSLRTEDDDELSNHVTAIPVSMATDDKDPIARLKAIHNQTSAAKREARGGGVGLVEVLQSLPPLVVGAMTALTSPDQTVQMMGANLVVSNVRGTSRPMYIAGARLMTMYPMSINTNGMGVNITCVSYCDSVDFGVAFAPELVPQPWQLVDGLEEALNGYLRTLQKRKGASASAKGKLTPKKKAAPTKKAALNKKATSKKKSTPRKKATPKNKTAPRKKTNASE